MNHADLTALLEASPPEVLASVAKAVLRGLRVLQVPRSVRLSEWAEQHFYLSKESSYVEQQWRAWPFQRSMLDVMGDDRIKKVTIRKSARVGYTKMLLAFLCYMHEHKRRNGVVYQPTDDDRDDFVTGELEPALRDIKVMRRVLPRMHSRSKHNTLKLKKFITGSMYLRGGKASKNYRRLTADYVVYDEFSGFDRDIEKEGSPGKLGDKRLEGAVFPKSIAGSTPKLKFNDNTEDREAEAQAHMRYKVPCWHCGHLHEIELGGEKVRHGLKWTEGDTSTVLHHCPSCGSGMSQAQYQQVWHAGVWVDQVTGQWIDAWGDWRTPASLNWQVVELKDCRDPATIVQPPEHVAMAIWTAYAPQASWPSIADEFVAASRLAKRGDMSLLKTFVNTTKGETWEEKGEAADEHALMKRAEDYPLCIVPVGALILTAGGDLQGNRLELGVWGWGRGLESWDIDHVIIELNPASDDDWLAVEQHLLRRYPQAWHGGTLGLDSISIDSNYQTQAVFNFVRRMQHRVRVYAVRGEGAEGLPIKGPGRPQDVNWRGQKWAHGIKQWSVGTDSAMDLIHGQLEIEQPGPGYVHLNKGRSREWFEQLTAEQRIMVKGPTGTAERWVKRRPRNEVVDCRKYALHSAYMLGLHSYSDRQWAALEAAVQPPPDLFSAPPPAPPPDVASGALELVAAAAAAAAPRQAPARPAGRQREW